MAGIARLLAVNMAIVTTYMRDLRALHGAGPLTPVLALQGFAERWAATQTLPLRHSSASWGENIALVPYMGDDGTSAVIASINLWYREVEAYDYRAARFSTSTGHFTQLVWRASRGYGVGAYYDGKAGVYVVMEYDPAGNVPGSFVDNVLPPYSFAPTASPYPPSPSQKPPTRKPPPPPKPPCRCTCA